MRLHVDRVGGRRKVGRRHDLGAAAPTSRSFRLLEPVFATRMFMRWLRENYGDGARHWPDGHAACRIDTRSMTAARLEDCAQLRSRG